MAKHSCGSDLIGVCRDNVFQICTEPDVLASIEEQYHQLLSEGCVNRAEIFSYAYARGMTHMLYDIVSGNLDINLIKMQKRKKDVGEKGLDPQIG